MTKCQWYAVPKECYASCLGSGLITVFLQASLRPWHGSVLLWRLAQGCVTLWV
jgi:hypothetical protein